MSLLHELQQDAAVLYEKRYEDERQNSRQLDQDIQRRAGRVLQRIAYRIANHRRFVNIGALATEIASFDVLLRVVPGAAGV